MNYFSLARFNYMLLMLGYGLLLPWAGLSQPDTSTRYRLAFYNVENLFDTEDDSLTQDEEYVWGGTRGWNYDKLSRKYRHIYKTLLALGEWNPPTIVGLVEVENRNVLENLISQTPLHRLQYAVVHYESPDERGIDAALLYRADQLEVVYSAAWPVVFPFDTANKTRDILYVKGILQQHDTLHLMVNHWPSRRGGSAYRTYAAQVVRQKVDSILQQNPLANIILTGDFNDEPHDESLTHLVNSSDSSLINISRYLEGTLKYQAVWSVFDQFVVSSNILRPDNTIFAPDRAAYAFRADWLLEKDEKYGGFKPKRTYVGYRYQEGFSDHLPVYLDIKINRFKEDRHF